ncbi:hypothetical protein R50073_22170 [Maricurvus nonylphenolicus]|uniref:hypothetical protein n=1 Tax=Maricurvus nonylphenolicus TaxID=1008307 RepID=UPI0036F2B577
MYLPLPISILLTRVVILIPLFGLSLNANAHVRWFAEEQASTIAFTWHPIYFLILIGGTLYCLFCYGFNRTEAAIAKRYPKVFNLWPAQLQWRLIAVMLGVALLINCLTNVFLAPNLAAQGLNSTANILQAIVAVSLITGLTPVVGGACLLAFMAYVTAITPYQQTIDYLPEFIALALALMLYKQTQLALAILRIGLGLQLIILAIHNKLLNPALGLAFLEQYPWNFMKMLGVPEFGDLEFVFAGGIAELCFGLMILLNWSTRFATLSITFFFTATALILGLHELVGHIPIMAVAIALISLGGGKLELPTRLRDTAFNISIRPKRIHNN